MKLLVIRHATPDYKNKTIKPQGHEEAKALAIKLKKIGVDRIYASPMGRAQHTMQYTSDQLGIACITEDWMQELVNWRLPDGQWPWKIHSQDVFDKRNFMDYKEWYNSPVYKGANIPEKFKSLERYSVDFFLRRGYKRVDGLYQCIEPNHDTIAVFCHAGFGAAWISHILGIPFSMIATAFSMSPTAVTYIEFSGEKDEVIHPKCLRFGDTSHLDHTELSYVD